MVSISQIELYSQNDLNKLVDFEVSNPGGKCPENEIADKLLEKDVNSKWLDFNCAPLVFDVTETVGAYRWMSSCDCPERDPTSWTFEEKRPGEEWKKIDERNFSGNLDRCNWIDKIIIERTQEN